MEEPARIPVAERYEAYLLEFFLTFFPKKKKKCFAEVLIALKIIHYPVSNLMPKKRHPLMSCSIEQVSVHESRFGQLYILHDGSFSFSLHQTYFLQKSCLRLGMDLFWSGRYYELEKFQHTRNSQTSFTPKWPATIDHRNH